MPRPAPLVSAILPLGAGCPSEAAGLRALSGLVSDRVEGIAAVRHGAAPPPLPPRVRLAQARPGEDPIAAGLAAACGPLAMLACGGAAAPAPEEALMRLALFPEPCAARLLILPRAGAAGGGALRPAGYERAARLLFAEGAPPPLSALFGPTALWRAALAPEGAGGLRGALTALRAESLGARIEAPLGPWREAGDFALRPATAQCMAEAEGLLGAAERRWLARRAGGMRTGTSADAPPAAFGGIMERAARGFGFVAARPRPQGETGAPGPG